MRIFRKILFITLALLPLLPLIFYGLSTFREGGYAFSQLEAELQNVASSVFQAGDSVWQNAFQGWINTISTTFGVPDYSVTLMLTYLAWLCIVELTMLLVDVIMWIPRKMREILSIKGDW